MAETDSVVEPVDRKGTPIRVGQKIVATMEMSVHGGTKTKRFRGEVVEVARGCSPPGEAWTFTIRYRDPKNGGVRAAHPEQVTVQRETEMEKLEREERLRRMATREAEDADRKARRRRSRG